MTTQTAAVRQLGLVSQKYQQMADEYYDVAQAAAEAEAGYRAGKARRMLISTHEGASAARAEIDADADDEVAELCSHYKRSAALADAHRAKLTQLREQVAVGRSILVTERAVDGIHAGSAT